MTGQNLPQVYSDLDAWIGVWLETHSRSARTHQAYCDTLADFRGWLRDSRGIDLDGNPALVALSAEQWAATSRIPGRKVTAATYRLRLSIISSFYKYVGMKRGLEGKPVINPIAGADHQKMGKVKPYARALPLSAQAIRKGLGSIDRSTSQGKRDYALLKLFVVTGRRLAEIANMKLGDLTFGETISVTFPECKGGEDMRDALTPENSAALAEWLAAWYRTNDLPSISKDAPVWVSLSRGGRKGRSYGNPLGIQAIGDLCLKYFGTSKVHTLRHTFAVMMEKAGASLSVIQRRLGHKNPATTGIYLDQLHSPENPYAGKLDDLLGASD